jgi:ABC-type antimicrobial peptide transport system permease subunit
MNIMLIAVYERTHEIGIMKSVGFKNRHIMVIFLCQAMIIGIMGGVAGIGLGAGASYAVASVLTHASSSASTTAASTTQTGSSGSSGSFRGGSSSGAGGATFVAGTGGGGAAASTSTTSLSYSPVFTPGTIAAALIVAITVSVIAGIYPAWRASKMDPIDALRAD